MKKQLTNLLTWSEQYTKTDMHYLTKGGFWLGLERAGVLLLGLIVAVAFANLMEPEKYGVYKYVLSIASIAGAFTLTGINTELGRSVARGFTATLRTATRYAFFWSITSTLILLCVSGYYFIQDNSILGYSFIAAALAAPIISATSLYGNYLIGKKQFRSKSIFGIIAHAVPFLLMLGALTFTNNPLIFALIFFGGNALILTIIYFTTVSLYPPKGESEQTLFKNSAHFSVMNIIGTFSAHADKVLIFSQLGGTQLAIYSFAILAPEQLRSLNAIISNLAFPKMAARDIASLKKTIPYKSLLLFIAGAIIAGAYIVAAPFLFTLLFPAYTAAVPLSQVMVLMLPITLPSILYSQTLITHMRKKELYILKIVSPLIRLGLMLLLFPLFGVWGIALGILGAYVIGFGLLLFLFFRMT